MSEKKSKYRLKPVKISNEAVMHRNSGEPSATLELEDLAGGFLTSRLTNAQRSNIIDPANGLLIFNTDHHHLELFTDRDGWKPIAVGSSDEIGGEHLEMVDGSYVSSINSQSGDVVLGLDDFDATGFVASINSQSGDVVLGLDDFDDTGSTNKFVSQAVLDKVTGIETGATGDQSDDEITTAYHNQVAEITAEEITSGAATDVRRYSPLAIKSMIVTHTPTPVVPPFMMGGYKAVLSSAAVVASALPVQDIQFASDFVGSFGAIAINPTTPMVFDVSAGGVTIGTITIATNGSMVFATVGNLVKTVVAGTLIQLIAPVSVDLTAAGLTISLKAIFV